MFQGVSFFLCRNDNLSCLLPRQRMQLKLIGSCLYRFFLVGQAFPSEEQGESDLLARACAVAAIVLEHVSGSPGFGRERTKDWRNFAGLRRFECRFPAVGPAALSFPLNITSSWA